MIFKNIEIFSKEIVDKDKRKVTANITHHGNDTCY